MHYPLKRNLDGIYLRVKRGDTFEPVCLSDMTEDELKEVLPTEKGEFLKGCVIQLALTLRGLAEQIEDVVGVPIGKE